MNIPCAERGEKTKKRGKGSLWMLYKKDSHDTIFITLFKILSLRHTLAVNESGKCSSYFGQQCFQQTFTSSIKMEERKTR